jgi:hypothetical protein
MLAKREEIITFGREMTLELQVDVPRTPLFFLKIMHIALSEFKEEVKLSVQHGDR